MTHWVYPYSISKVTNRAAEIDINLREPILGLIIVVDHGDFESVQLKHTVCRWFIGQVSRFRITNFGLKPLPEKIALSRPSRLLSRLSWHLFGSHKIKCQIFMQQTITRYGPGLYIYIYIGQNGSSQVVQFLTALVWQFVPQHRSSDPISDKQWTYVQRALSKQQFSQRHWRLQLNKVKPD